MSIVGTRPPLISETNLYEPRHKVNVCCFNGDIAVWCENRRFILEHFNLTYL